jgi:hypothetical protein
MMTLALDVVTFIWTVLICGAEVPRPQQTKQTKGRASSWAQSLAEIQAI